MSFEPSDLEPHLEALYRYCLSMTHDQDLAGDTVQDTVVRALERRGQYRADAPLGHWLMRIAHNLVIDRARQARHELPVETIEEDWRDDTYSVDADAVVQRAATREELLDALVRLPTIYRSAVLLHDVEGLRVLDIAELHGISLPAAKQRLRRGRMAMVSALADGHRRRVAMKGVPMPCWGARKHISDYLNGELDSATAALIERHLETCPTCPPLYAALVGVNDELGRLRDPDSVIDPAVERRIRTVLRP